MQTFPEILSTKVIRPSSAGQPKPPPVDLGDLLNAGLVLLEDWEALHPDVRAEVERAKHQQVLLALLVQHSLLTEFQAGRITEGATFGLLLGSYRVLDRLGSGGMGTVYRAEHVHLRRQVAVKVLHPSYDHGSLLLERFYSEVRAVGRLQHPNVVAALDIGEAHCPGGGSPPLHYFVMEYVSGHDLERLVKTQGPLPAPKACDVVHQVASALAEAHKHGLVHRDIKPSNILVMPDGQAKLLDFGLAMLVSRRMTTHGTAMGSIEYMAPEQARDASAVDIRADVYALGGTMLWALTGRSPFQTRGNVSDLLTQRRAATPPAVEIGPEVPPGLRAVLGRMMAPRAEDRYATPHAVMEALRPFLKPDLRDHGATAECGVAAAVAAAGGDLAATVRLPGSARTDRVLIVDDDADVRQFCKSVLEHPAVRCHEAADGAQALEAVAARRYDLVLLDIDMPGMNGREVLRRLREAPPCPHLKVIMFSGRATGDDMAEMLLAGADDYLTKPFSVVQLQARIKAALRFKEAQERSDRLNQNLLATNRELEESLKNRQSNLLWIRNSLVLALSKLVEYRDSETGEHLIRLQRYCRCLAEEAALEAPFKEQIDANFIDMLESCVPLHDIGKATVPDHILLKPGKLTLEERIIMQRHTVVGRDTLQGITTQQALSPAFLQTALDIVCYHHERWDGRGYPEGLTGTDIPLAARIVTIADVYDALRARRVYKPALSHAAAVEVMTKGSEGQFDPALLACFTRCALHFEQIFHELPD